MVWQAGNDWMATLERIDQTLGYTKENTVLICYEFNTGHSQWSRDLVTRVRGGPATA